MMNIKGYLSLEEDLMILQKLGLAPRTSIDLEIKTDSCGANYAWDKDFFFTSNTDVGSTFDDR